MIVVMMMMMFVVTISMFVRTIEGTLYTNVVFGTSVI